MPIYIVECRKFLIQGFRLEADSPEEALKIAQDEHSLLTRADYLGSRVTDVPEKLHVVVRPLVEAARHYPQYPVIDRGN